MTQLLGLSFDSPTSPSIRLKGIEKRQDASLDAIYGWGLAWYPQDGPAAMVVKDPTSIGTNALTKVLSDWARFSSTLFVAHLRGAAKRRTAQDTHPFSRTHAGRDWVLTHNGDLRHGFREALALPADSPFEPIGGTDTEYILCWLLDRLRRRGIRRLRDVDPTELTATMRQLNGLGTLNLLLADGTDLVAYSDAFGYRPLYWTEHRPPDALIRASDASVELRLGSNADLNRTAVVIASRPLSEGPWTSLRPGTLLLARRGMVAWQSDALPEDWATRPDSGQLDMFTNELPVSDIPAPVVRELPDDAPTFEEAQGSVMESSIAPTPMTWPDTRVSEVVLHAPPLEDVEPDEAGTIEALQRAADALRAPEVRSAGLARSTPTKQPERVLETLHVTTYTYDKPIQLSTHLFRLQPAHDLNQELLDFRLRIEPAGPLRTYEDVFGNPTTETAIRKSYTTLRIVAQSRVRLTGTVYDRLHSAADQGRIPLVWMPWQRQMMLPYLLPPELPESQLRELSDYGMSFVKRQDYDLVGTLMDINQTIFRDYTYATASTHLATTAFDVYAQRRGVCQDFANLFICLARLLGVPARYRVGYIYTGNNYANTRQGDASHAWVEVYLPQVGWRGLDPTNGVLANHDHVRVAAGRNYRDAAPTGGVIYEGGGDETLEVVVKVIDQTGRVPERRFELGV